jgi:hypothetical protein
MGTCIDINIKRSGFKRSNFTTELATFKKKYIGCHNIGQQQNEGMPHHENTADV